MPPLLAAALIAFLSAGAARAAEITPAIVFSMGGKLDKSFNEGVHDGAEAFTKESGDRATEIAVANLVEVLQAPPMTRHAHAG